jgi:hypothetical protein
MRQISRSRLAEALTMFRYLTARERNRPHPATTVSPPQGEGIPEAQMKVLVLASEPISADQLRAALEDDGGASLDEVEVRIVAPALAESGLQFWLSDADDAIAKAEEVWRTSVDELGAAGVEAQGDTGEADPTRALADALTSFDADRIVAFTHPDGERRYREDLDEDELERLFGRPVEHVSIPSSS